MKLSSILREGMKPQSKAFMLKAQEVLEQLGFESKLVLPKHDETVDTFAGAKEFPDEVGTFTGGMEFKRKNFAFELYTYSNQVSIFYPIANVNYDKEPESVLENIKTLITRLDKYVPDYKLSVRQERGYVESANSRAHFYFKIDWNPNRLLIAKRVDGVMVLETIDFVINSLVKAS